MSKQLRLTGSLSKGVCVCVCASTSVLIAMQKYNYVNRKLAWRISYFSASAFTEEFHIRFESCLFSFSFCFVSNLIWCVVYETANCAAPVVESCWHLDAQQSAMHLVNVCLLFFLRFFLDCGIKFENFLHFILMIMRFLRKLITRKPSEPTWKHPTTVERYMNWAQTTVST